MPIWVTEWLGFPYDRKGRGPKGYDCFGLWRAVYEHRFGVVVPDPYPQEGHVIRQGGSRQLELMFRKLDSCAPVSEGAALLIRDRGHPLHIGYAIDNEHFLHTTSEMGSHVSRRSEPLWKYRHLGSYVYVG